MRFVLIILSCFVALTTTAFAAGPQDSLFSALATVPDSEKVNIYRNLADIYYRLPEEEQYLRKTYDYAHKYNLREAQLEALSDIVIFKIEAKQIDSAKYYIDEVSDLAPRGHVGKWVSYLSMYLFNYMLYEDPQAGETAISEKSALIKEGGKSDIYTQVEQAYMVATSVYIQRKYDEALPYVLTMINLAEALPFKDGCRYHLLALRLHSRILSRTAKHAEAIAMTEETIKIMERYVDQYYKSTRPYYPMDEFYIKNYTEVMFNTPALSDLKSEFYIARLRNLSKKTTIPTDKYNCFLALNNYYLSRSDWKQSLQTNDSLIRYAHIIAPYNLSGLHRMNSFIYEKLNRPEDALSSMKVAYLVRDSVSALEANEKLNELQVEYDLNKLNYEKSQLEIKNKMTFIVSLLIVLSLVVFLCVYLYRNLKRERSMKARLHSLMLRAEESERMKSRFINSICHEIRTPLNAISGFSSLIFDPSVDDEMKECFPIEIQRNTRLLTSLIDCMLEVSHLDVSDEKLPCEQTDISHICNSLLEDSREIAMEGVECSVEFGSQPMLISTNEHYLSLVLDNLLSNACKFTQKGSVVVRCDVRDKLFVMSVTDTGCGIPEDMQEAVFDRFTKLDSYKQGSGLGLYLCKLVVTRLLGRIYVDPSYRDGTRMIIELPLD